MDNTTQPSEQNEPAVVKFDPQLDELRDRVNAHNAAQRRLHDAAQEMLMALIGVSVIAQQNIEALNMPRSYFHTAPPLADFLVSYRKMEIARWQAVLDAIDRATGSDAGDRDHVSAPQTGA